MSRSGVWRLLILCATLLCVVMLFAPLVTDVVEHLAEEQDPVP
jgi:hypothetical protein